MSMNNREVMAHRSTAIFVGVNHVKREIGEKGAT